MGKKGGATPVVDKSKASEANLNVIKRIDPDVEEVRRASALVRGHSLQGKECRPSPSLCERAVARARAPSRRLTLDAPHTPAPPPKNQNTPPSP